MASILFKRGASNVLADKNYVPAEGEPVFETDTGRFKIGRKDEYGNLMSWDQLHYQDEATLLSYPNYNSFPKVNRLNVIYKDESTGTLYQGTGGTTYKPMSSNGTVDNITTIYGGNANGTT